MSFQPKTYYSQIYRNFRAIEATEFRRIVRFYERHEKSILQLDFDEYFEMLVTYTDALFEIGEYRKHILMADAIVETSILENITHVGGQEIFRATLFRKAASHYNLRDFAKATHVLSELIKIDPSDDYCIRFLERVFRDERPQLLRATRALTILLLLVSVVAISVEVLIVRHFFPENAASVEWLRNLVFATGVITLVTGLSIHRWRAYRRVCQVVNNAKKSMNHKREIAS